MRIFRLLKTRSRQVAPEQDVDIISPVEASQRHNVRQVESVQELPVNLADITLFPASQLPVQDAAVSHSAIDDAINGADQPTFVPLPYVLPNVPQDEFIDGIGMLCAAQASNEYAQTEEQLRYENVQDEAATICVNQQATNSCAQPQTNLTQLKRETIIDDEVETYSINAREIADNVVQQRETIERLENKAIQPEAGASSANSNNRTPPDNIYLTSHASKMVQLVTLICVVTRIPAVIVLSIWDSHIQNLQETHKGWFIFFLIVRSLGIVNFAANPVLYSLVNRTFRDDCRKILLRLFRFWLFNFFLPFKVSVAIALSLYSSIYFFSNVLFMKCDIVKQTWINEKRKKQEHFGIQSCDLWISGTENNHCAKKEIDVVVGEISHSKWIIWNTHFMNY